MITSEETPILDCILTEMSPLNAVKRADFSLSVFVGIQGIFLDVTYI